MRIIETKANITGDRLLSVQLPEDIEAGQYQVAIIINSQPETKPPQHKLNQLAGKITAFKNIDPVAWQKQVRGEWDETRLADRSQQRLMDRLAQNPIEVEEWQELTREQIHDRD